MNLPPDYLTELDSAELIRVIEDLFPADAPSPATAIIGRDLLRQARENCDDWRNASQVVLCEYARLCIEQDRRMDANQRRANERDRRSLSAALERLSVDHKPEF